MTVELTSVSVDAEVLADIIPETLFVLPLNVELVKMWRGLLFDHNNRGIVTELAVGHTRQCGTLGALPCI